MSAPVARIFPSKDVVSGSVGPEPVKDPSKDEMKATISASLQTIDGFKSSMTKVVETLRQTLGNDCTFVAIRDCSNALAQVAAVEKEIRKCRNALEKRGKALLRSSRTKRRA